MSVETDGPGDVQRTLTVAVLGCGQMGGALARGWVRTGIVAPENLRLFDVHWSAADTLSRDTGGSHVFSSGADAVRGADVVLAMVKPYLIASVLGELRDAGALSDSALVISPAPGIRLATLEAAAGNGKAVVRVMPNTPSLVGEGAAAFCRGAHATPENAATVQSLFGAVGVCIEVANEGLLDAVTAVSGSSPAYFYLIVEALTDGAVRAGLPRDTARILAAQSMLGAAKMILTTGTHPMALKDAVTTPGGTTIAALGVLESAGLRGTLMEAVRIAAERSKEMG